jgi:lysophospholipase L1-like esterase
MITVVLIGDSIRMGYQETVRSQLAGWADVWGPEENGGTSERVLANLDDWALSRPFSVLHINCGLHDLKREFGQDENAVPLEDYEKNVRAIMTRAKEATQAPVVWALTTPVNEAWHHETKPFDRFEVDVGAYNAVARDLAGELGVIVNDLFGVVTSAGRDDLLLPDGVHFKPEGYALLGGRVADCCRGIPTV